MINPIDSIANVIKAGAEAFEILGSVTSGVIREASRIRGKYAQRDGETVEGYRIRLEFLERKERIREGNKSRRQETKAQERLAHRDLQVLWNRIGLTIHLLAATTGLLFVAPSWGAEVYLDSQCQRVSVDSKNIYRYQRVDFRRNIQSFRQMYWFSLARAIDGSAIFCLTQPNYTEGRLLAANQLQNQFIREIKQESKETSFLITVAYGNGLRVPLVQFRLSLDEPMKPKLTKLREWRSAR